jgi:glycosyltransferase involved in cell wall biosynthesis
VQVKIAVVTAVDMTFRVGLLAQIKAAQDEGFVVHGVCTKGPNFRFLVGEGLHMYPVTIARTISPLHDLLTVWRLYRYFRRANITIVHTHTPKPGLLGQLAARLAGVPIIVNTLHGFYFHENMRPWVRRFYVIMEWVAARCSSMILSQNLEDIETAVELGICRRDKIRLLGNGVDLSRFDPARFDGDFRRKKRQEIGVPDDAVVVGIMGRLVKEKGYLELFSAMQRIIRGNEKVWLVIIGPEEPEKSDRISVDIVKEYEIETQTRWLGRRDDIPELLACCDIYCLPSWREGLPRSAIEAAAMRLPVVATKIRGCRQVVEDGVNGLLVPLKDVDALTSAIKKLIGDEEARVHMGQAGYEKARREFDERRVCEVVLDTYDRLLAENSRGAAVP